MLSSALQQVRPVSSAQVSALLEDHNGKLWIGTAEERVSALYEDRGGTVYKGLWNNTGWEVWKDGRMHKERLSGLLPEEQREARHLDGANWISDFLEDSQGRFWVVTWEGVGLNEWDRRARRSLPPRWLSPFRYPSPQVDSNIFLSSRLGSRLIEDLKGNLVYATTQAGYVTDLCLTPDGAIWAATRSGLWSPSGGHFLDGMLVQSVESDAKGRLWAGTEDGLYFIDTDGSTGRVPKELGFPSDIYGEPLVNISRSSMSDSGKNIKRAIDIVVSVLALIMLTPVYAIVACIIKSTSPGPIFYLQERIGLHNKPFSIIKFRSMVKDAESAGKPQLSSDDDPRITPFGHFMRKYRIDELPQFWNVLKGDMSIVGPRPERKYYIDQIIQRVPAYALLHQVRPGITSMGMVKYGYAKNVDEMVERVKYDLMYLDNMSLLNDLKILIYTIRIVFTGRGM